MQEPPHKIPESVLVVIHTAALDVLLLRRADARDYWQSVTGSRDSADEAFAQTAAREVFEETGIDCRAGTPLAAGLRDWGQQNVYEIYPEWRHRFAPGVTQNTEHVFGLRLPERMAIRLDTREHVGYRWLAHAAAADACSSPTNAAAILLLPQFAA